MSLLGIAYLLLAAVLVAGLGFAAVAILRRSFRQSRVQVAEGDCRESRLIELGESTRRDCED